MTVYFKKASEARKFAKEHGNCGIRYDQAKQMFAVMQY